MPERLLSLADLVLHAPAEIERQCQAQRAALAAEERHPLPLAVVRDAEVRVVQAQHGLPLPSRTETGTRTVRAATANVSSRASIGVTTTPGA